MSKTIMPDPLTFWRDATARWEKALNELGGQAMGTEEFSRSMNQVTSLSLGLQQAMGELLSRYFAVLNIPSRADITALGERLQAIERTVNRLATLLERQAGGDRLEPSAGGARPPRTKRPAAKAATSEGQDVVRQPVPHAVQPAPENAVRAARRSRRGSARRRSGK